MINILQPRPYPLRKTSNGDLLANPRKRKAKILSLGVVAVSLLC